MLRIIAILTVLLISVNASAQQFQAEFKNWALFSYTEDGSKVCYITSSPTRKTGTYKIRGDVYMLVTYRGEGTVPEVSIDTGFPYRQGSDVSFVVDGKKQFTFFTSPETPQMSWAKDEQADRTVIDALKRGGRVNTKGTSTRGTTAQDTYSLRGFTAAYNKMIASCK